MNELKRVGCFMFEFSWKNLIVRKNNRTAVPFCCGSEDILTRGGDVKKLLGQKLHAFLRTIA